MHQNIQIVLLYALNVLSVILLPIVIAFSDNGNLGPKKLVNCDKGVFCNLAAPLIRHLVSFIQVMSWFKCGYADRILDLKI